MIFLRTRAGQQRGGWERDRNMAGDAAIWGYRRGCTCRQTRLRTLDMTADLWQHSGMILGTVLGVNADHAFGGEGLHRGRRQCPLGRRRC